MPSSNMSAKKKTINDTCEKCFNYNVSRLTSLSWDPLGSPWLPTNNKQANEKAVLYNKTKDPKLKEEWHKLVKQFGVAYDKHNPQEIFTDLQ